jgi:ATP-binding cassette subfamily F protein uup
VRELEAEALAHARADKLLAQEEVWVRKGVEARRTRSVGRVARLQALRARRAERREQLGQVRLALDTGLPTGRIVAELQDVGMRYGERVLVQGLSATILRGDKVGLIGPNGSGKTTLLKLILGELEPTSGRVRRGTKLQVAYFDQMRAALDLDATLADTISPGSEWVEIGAARKHVMSYLGDFLFARARQLARAHALRRGAQPAAAGAAVRAAGQRARARRADQRPGHRHAGPAGGAAAGLRRHGLPRQPRPALPRQRGARARWPGRATPPSAATRACGASSRAATRTGCVQRARAAAAAGVTPAPAPASPAAAAPPAPPAPAATAPEGAARKLSYKETARARAVAGAPGGAGGRAARHRRTAGRCFALRARAAQRAAALHARHAQIEEELLAGLERWEALAARA